MPTLLRSLFALIALIVAIVLCGQLFHLPYAATNNWLIVSWGGINTLFAGLFYYLSIKNQTFQHPSIYKKWWLVINAILNATMVTFFILVAAADATLFFARQPFKEQAIIREIECHENQWLSFFKEYSTIHFSKDKTRFSLIFRNNVCREYPGAEESLKNQSVYLYGRKWFFGKYYDRLAFIDSHKK